LCFSGLIEQLNGLERNVNELKDGGVTANKDNEQLNMTLNIYKKEEHELRSGLKLETEQKECLRREFNDLRDECNRFESTNKSLGVQLEYEL